MRARVLKCSRCGKFLNYDSDGTCDAPGCHGIIKQVMEVVTDVCEASDEDLKLVDMIGLNVSPVDEPMSRAIDLCTRLYKLGRKKVVWLSFDGYDEDPREVWEIPECIEWARQFLIELGSKMSTLGDDLDGKPGLGFGIAAVHVVAGYGLWQKKESGTYDFSVPDLVLRTIMESYEEV